MSATPLQIDVHTGLLAGVRQVLSNHHDARPQGVEPDLIVVHNISLPPGEFGTPWIDHLFTGTLPRDAHSYFSVIPPGRVSAHVLVRRDGTPVQYVPFGRRAWHAGQSEYLGRKGCNDFSVGIELEGTDDLPFEDAQYTTLAAVIRALLSAYETLAAERVAGHCDIAPGRKTDPGPAFDWPRLRALVGG